jgi:hypothetical protein
MSVCLCNCLSVCRLSVCLSVCLIAHLLSCSPACLPADLRSCRPVCLSSFLSACLPVCLPAYCMSVCLSAEGERKRYDQLPMAVRGRHGVSMRVRSAPNELQHRALVAGLPANPSLFKSMYAVCRPRYS